MLQAAASNSATAAGTASSRGHRRRKHSATSNRKASLDKSVGHVLDHGAESGTPATTDATHHHSSGSQQLQPSSAVANKHRDSLLGRQLYLSNLPANASWRDVKDLMRAAGDVVRANIIGNGTSTGDDSGRQAIVVFASPQCATRAIEVFDGFKWRGRRLNVHADDALNSVLKSRNNSLSFTQHSATDASKDMASDVASGQESVVHVGNLPPAVGWQDLKDLFRECGTVLRTDIQSTSKASDSALGSVHYASVDEARLARELFDGFLWFGRRISVSLQQPSTTEVAKDGKGTTGDTSSNVAPAAAPINIPTVRRHSTEKTVHFLQQTAATAEFFTASPSPPRTSHWTAPSAPPPPSSSMHNITPIRRPQWHQGGSDINARGVDHTVEGEMLAAARCLLSSSAPAQLPQITSYYSHWTTRSLTEPRDYC